MDCSDWLTKFARKLFSGSDLLSKARVLQTVVNEAYANFSNASARLNWFHQTVSLAKKIVDENEYWRIPKVTADSVYHRLLLSTLQALAQLNK